MANQFILASAGPVNLDVRDLGTGNSNSYFITRICQKNILFSGDIKFMYAGTSDIYLICNKDSSTLGDCQPQVISGINNVGFITSGIITYRMSGVSLDGYDALFVGNSNTIFKVNLSINGKYKGYSTY